MDFPCLYEHGFARVAACTQRTAVADPAANAAAILRQARELHDEGVAVAVFPELTLTGYSIEDLLLQDAVLEEVEAMLSDLVAQTADLLPVLVVGAPLRHRNRIYNCAVVVHRGRVLGVVPKSYPPTYREFYEGRQLAHGDLERGGTIRLGAQEVPFGVDLLFAAEDLEGLVVHVEICEDMWIPIPPSAEAALAGATVLLNLSGSPITVGRARDRKLMCQSASSRCLAAYLYSAAGQGESTTDLSWDGQTLVYENGVLLAETERFPDSDRRSVADVDLDLLRSERARMGTFDDNRRTHHQRTGDFRRIAFTVEPPAGDLGLLREVERFPFVPSDPDKLELDCYEAYNIQVAGLQQRLEAIGAPKVVIGVSGGLDSTHALIVAAKAMDRAERPRSDILGFTLPGFATSAGTKSNAHQLMNALGVTATELDITETAELMLRNLEHPYSRGEEIYDVTFENVQAGLRTDYLFRIANQRGGIVLGTGDLSELALGWATYGVGDQMSHYNVNAGIPKTFIKHLIRWVMESRQFGEGEVNGTLEAILETEISPELVPGEELQSTESTIGPYALHDFTLFYTLRYGFRPSKIGFLAWHAWRDVYDQAEIRRWLEVFCKRFFAFAQFKRSALPNGPKVSAGGSLSPRGDWRAPSDSSAEVWLRDLERWR
jgi:NAD+ synthase (glutamine-hydrolysing)